MMLRTFSLLTWRLRLALVVAAAVLGWIAFQYLYELDPRFSPHSIAGLRGLAAYLVADYGDAARDYWSQTAQFVTRNATAFDPAWAAFVRGDMKTAKQQANAQITSKRARQGWLTLGEIALAEERPADALQALRQVLDAEVDQFDAGLLSSVAYARLGQHADAITMLSRTMRYDRAESRITAFYAVLETVSHLAAGPGTRPLSLLAFYHRYLRIYDPSQGAVATRYARAAIKAGDAPDAAYVTIGVVESKQGHWDAALDAFLSAAKINSRNPEAFLWASRAYSRRGDLVNELRTANAAREAAARDPYYTRALNAVLVVKLGDYRQALQLYTAVLEEQPNNASLWHSLSEVYHQLGDEQQSLAAASRAAALDPADSSHVVKLGWALIRTRQDLAALATFERAVAIDPTDESAHYGRAAALDQLKRFPEAIAAYELSFRLLPPTRAESLAPLCELYFETSAFEHAQRCLQRALAIDPEYVRASRILQDVEANLRLKASQR